MGSGSPELLHIGNTLGEDASLPTHLLDLQLEDADVLQSLAVLHLPLVQSGLLDLDLLI